MRPILYVDSHTCQACAKCQARLACKPRALVQFERGDLPMIDVERCLACQACVPACPFGAVRRADVPMPVASR